MRKGVCPKCQSKEVYHGTKVGLKSGWNNSNTIPVTGLKAAALDNYVCGGCGYVESYVAKEKDLTSIKKKWELVF
jgi:predicted nucleic-acid-binding Zn-ribbon protein